MSYTYQQQKAFSDAVHVIMTSGARQDVAGEVMIGRILQYFEKPEALLILSKMVQIVARNIDNEERAR